MLHVCSLVVVTQFLCCNMKNERSTRANITCAGAGNKQLENACKLTDHLFFAYGALSWLIVERLYLHTKRIVPHSFAINLAMSLILDTRPSPSSCLSLACAATGTGSGLGRLARAVKDANITTCGPYCSEYFRTRTTYCV